MEFNVSVIIPVYNCESYIEKAIVSALNQPEVYEVVVVNDGSTDRTEEILKKIQVQTSKLKVYYHPNRVNKGRSATRNLGIIKAEGNYIAFLDADDFYEPNRFSNDKKELETNKKADGIYNAVGFHFYRETNLAEEKLFKLNTITHKIEPDLLFELLINGKNGFIHLNGLTLKKSVFHWVGLFNETLVVAEDSDLIFKLAMKCSLISGVIDHELAKRGIHNFNIFNRDDLYNIYNIKMYESVYFWSAKNNVSKKKIDILLKWIWIFKYKENKSLMHYIKDWLYMVPNSYKLFFSYLTIKYFPLVRLRQKLFPFLYGNYLT